MRGVESEGPMELEDDDEMAEIFGTEGDLGSTDTIGDGPEPKPSVEEDAERQPEIEEDDDLLEPNLDKLGPPVRNVAFEDPEFEALIDADFDAEDEDEFEIALLQEMGIEIGDDSGMTMIAVNPDVPDSDSFDDEVAA